MGANTTRILVIAGSDCSGGAGLEADQKVIAAFGCYAMTATTALTVQDTQGVYDIHHTPPGFVKKQIDACINDIGVDVVKTGMLASAETIRSVADALRSHGSPFAVVDPVLASTSGSQLLPEDAVKDLCGYILPLATVLTPNVPEARLILEAATGNAVAEPKNLDEMIDLTKQIQTLGIPWVLVKGGHLPLLKNYVVATEDTSEPKVVVNILHDGTNVKLFESAFQASKNTHGTGCSLASAIASNVSLGHDVPKSVEIACDYVEKGIRTAVKRGQGNGSINHFHSTYIKPFDTIESGAAR